MPVYSCVVSIEVQACVSWRLCVLVGCPFVSCSVGHDDSVYGVHSQEGEGPGEWPKVVALCCWDCDRADFVNMIFLGIGGVAKGVGSAEEKRELLGKLA